MRLFRKRIELSEKEMNEFIQTVATQTEPRYGKREEREQPEAEPSAYSDGMRAEEEDETSGSEIRRLYSEEPEEIRQTPTGKMSGRDIRGFLEEQCENIRDSSRQIEAVRAEYQEVTAYLQDTQLIDRAGEEEREVIEDAARHILTLRKEMEKLKKRRYSLTDFQYRTLERYESILPRELGRLEEEEEYHTLIKSDMQKLEGEKGALLYEQEEIENRRVFLIRMSIITGIVTVLLFGLYLYFWFGLETVVTTPFLITAGGAAVITAWLFFENRRNVYNRKLNEKKRNRLITLQNRVKIKYVNNTASLDYSYDKYAVNNSRELRYRWEQYVDLKDEMNRKEQSREVLRYYERQLFQVLDELELHDPDVWSSQAEALIDQREMVEIRHRLNVRRQKLRERLDYNTRIRDKARLNLRKFGEKYPQAQSRLQIIMNSYEVTL